MIHQETTWYFLVHFLPNWIYTTVTISEKVQTNQILTYPSPINVKDRKFFIFSGNKENLRNRIQRNYCSVVSGKANWHPSIVFLLNQLGPFFLAEINQGER